MPTSDERELILKAYCELGQIERSHSNNQTSYRMLASTWMLAAFAGIGFMISSKEFSFDIPKEVFILAIALAGGIGLGLLWILDLLFYPVRPSDRMTTVLDYGSARPPKYRYFER
jgi:hypothetical protein